MSETVATLTSGHRLGSSSRKLLVFIAGAATEHVLPDSGVVMVGRGRGVDITIDHPTLSRSHAKLTLGAHVTVEDCGSRNGTVIGGRALAPGEVVLVAPGSPIEVGDALLIIRAGSSAADMLASSDASLGKDATLERMVKRIAEADISVLVIGEPGTGKSFLGKQIHELSARRQGPFATLRCGNVREPRDIVSALGAARGGVLLIHEPASLPPELQTVLLETLEAERNNVRTITTTTRDLPPLVARGAFSNDLVHRLGAVSVAVPPVRARLRELPSICEAIVASVAAEHNRPTPLLSADALAALGRHAWPGNVRELKNALTRAVLLGSGRVLTAAHFELDAANQAAGAGAGTLSSAVSEAEHRRILEALRQCNGNQTRAAKLLGISRGTLISRLERYSVPRPRK